MTSFSSISLRVPFWAAQHTAHAQHSVGRTKNQLEDVTAGTLTAISNFIILEAFLALSVTHDANKGAFKRALRTGLNIDDVEA